MTLTLLEIAIWDNRSVFHTATYDIEGQGPRTGQRAVSLGERPYLDPNSTGRREVLDKLEADKNAEGTTAS